MNSYKLLHAMSGIREDYVLEAMDFLGYVTEKARPHRVNRKLWMTLLVAAIIVSLFTVTAYAMGWFGLRERMIESAPETSVAEETSSPENSPAPTAEPKRWVSLNGYADSPEYRANAEWLRFREEYLASQAERAGRAIRPAAAHASSLAPHAGRLLLRCRNRCLFGRRRR